MEPPKEVFERLITNKVLDSLIQDTTCLRTLKFLLQVKEERVLGGQCEKITFCLSSLYDCEVDVGLGRQILKSALYVMADNTALLSQTQSFCLSKLQSSQTVDELYYCCNLLNVLFDYYNNEKLTLSKWTSGQFSTGILNPLIISSKPLFTFVTVYLLPNYFTVCNQNDKGLFLENLFKFIKNNKKLELLCVLWPYFAPSDLNEDNFNVLKLDDFWKLIIECLSSQAFQKQAIYLLSKSTEIAFKLRNVPNYLKVENSTENEKIWRNYFTLLDVSNEKQLHFIEPSLHMLGSIKPLHIAWRLCLYKILLHHSQITVVYSIVNFILENENAWQDFSKILENLLFALNKHEYNEQSKSIFRKIGVCCSEFNEIQFECFLGECLKVSWTPSALWGLFSNVFNDEIRFQISFELFCNVIKKIRMLPHKFIRESCTRIVLTKNHTLESMEDVLKISALLWDFNEFLFQSFIINYAQETDFKNKLCEKFQTSVKNSNEKEVEIEVKIFHILEIEVPSVLLLKPFTQQTDLIFDFFAENVETIELEKYVLSRIESVLETEDISALLKIILKISTPTLCQKAEIILSEQQYNTSQKIIAFGILHKKQNCDSIITFCKNVGNDSEPLTVFFVKILLNSLNKNPPSKINECVNFFKNILDKQSSATITILENISIILKFLHHEIVFDFFTQCLNEFLNLYKSGSFKTTANVFMEQIFAKQFFEHEKFCTKILEFVQRLLPISNSVTYLLAKLIRSVCQQSPHKSLIFVPVIVELILHGIVISKNERVEYSVCQEIYSKLGKNQNNPNFEEMSIRLIALDTMLDLVNNLKTEIVVNQFVSILIEKYKEYFTKRYFPDSQIHFQKLRIMQTLLLLHKHIKDEKTPLINLLIESFLLESHQPSVKHLMQWLLICLLKTDSDFFIQTINDKLKSINSNRPSTISGFIPILYNIVTLQNEAHWEQVVEMLLPYTMGPQFKLRFFSQVALIKLYEKAKDKRLDNFTEKYQILYNSLKQVLAATSNVDADIIKHEFLDYINLEQCDCSTIFYLIPRKNGVLATEWENLNTVSVQFKFLSFNHSEHVPKTYYTVTNQAIGSDNIQKKITPWRDLLDNKNQPQENNFILVTTLIEKSTNLGGLSRTCEVFGVKQIVMRTAKVVSDKEFKSLSMSSENSVDILEVKVEDLKNYILEMKKQGYSVVGAEQTSESVKLDVFRFANMTLLVLGNEKEGIPPYLIPLLDHCIEIPQFGLVRSLNVHVAGAIVIWEYCKQQKL